MNIDKVLALYNLKIKEDKFYILTEVFIGFILASIVSLFSGDENISRYLFLILYFYSILLVIGSWLGNKNKIYDTYLPIKQKILLEYFMYYYRLLGIALIIVIFLPKNIHNFTILLAFIIGYSFFINAMLFGDVNMRVIIYLYVTANLPLFLVYLSDQFFLDNEVISLGVAICCLGFIPYNYKYAIKYTGILNYT